MSKQYPGGVVSKTPVTPTSISAPGVWTLNQQAAAQATNTWPFPRDPQFNYVTMLLHGDGSAGVPSTGSGAGASTTVTNFNADASTNNFNVTINGDARSNNFTPYQGNGYYSNYFNGSTDYLGIADNVALQIGSGDFTLEAWINLSSLPASGAYYIIAGKYSSTANCFFFDVNNNSGTLQLFIGGTTGSVAGNYAFAVNTWYHVAAVRNGATTTLYVNGTSVASGTFADNIVASGIPYRIGVIQSTSSSSFAGYFNGYISNNRLVKGTAVYTSNFTPSTTPLTAVSGTSVLTCQSNQFIDNSSNAFTITTSGTPQVAPAQPFTLPSSVATYGSGYFSGTAGGYLETAYNSALDASTGPFTYEAWLNPSTTTNKQYLGGSVTNAFFAFVGSGTIFVGRNNVAVDFTSNATIVTNQWNHVVIVRNSSNNIAIFINGSRQYYAASNTNNYGLASNSLRVGVATTGSSYEYNGYITDVKIAKSALYDPTASTITVPTTPLTAGSAGLLTTQYNGGGNNSGFKDSSQNNFVITRNGNTTQGTFTPYGSNWSNYFDGSSHLTTASSTALQAGTGAFTLEGWINVTGSTSGSILSQIPDVNAGYGIGIGYEASSNLLTGVITTTSTTAWIGSITPVKGVWYHMAFVRDASTNIALFINGVKITPTTGSSTNTTNINTATTFVSGPRFYDNPTRAGFRLTGYVSNARFVKGSAIYDPTAASITVPTSQLTAVTNTQLLILQANRIYDGSSNAFAITYSGTQSVQCFSPFAPLTVYNPATNGGSGYFDGSGDYLTLPSSPSFGVGTGNFTIDAWIYPTSAWAGAGSYNPIFLVTGTGGLYFGQNSAGFGLRQSGTANIISYGTSPTLNAWTHVSIVRSGTTVTMYYNGVSVATATSSANFTSGPIQIGYDGSYGIPSMYLADLRIVNGIAIVPPTGGPTAPLTAVTGTALLLNTTNAGILDNAMMNDLETVGNAQISTSVKKYGTGSMYFDGSGDWLNASSSPNYGYGSGDFTIEFWAYPTSSSGLQVLLDQRTGSSTSAVPTIYTSSGTIYYYVSGSNRITGGSLSLNQWSHISICRSGTSTKLFINGTQSGSTFTDTTTYLNAPVRVGDGNDGAGPYPYLGYIDDLRITKGYARYTGNFTPPTTAFPNG